MGGFCKLCSFYGFFGTKNSPRLLKDLHLMHLWGQKGRGQEGGADRVWTLDGNLGSYLGVRNLYPLIMASAEKATDMTKNGVTGARRCSPRKLILTTPFKYQEDALLDIKMCPVPYRKEQLHLLFQSYLPMY